jgi:hypothetical protein
LLIKNQNVFISSLTGEREKEKKTITVVNGLVMYSSGILYPWLFWGNNFICHSKNRTN